MLGHEIPHTTLARIMNQRKNGSFVAWTPPPPPHPPARPLPAFRHNGSFRARTLPPPARLPAPRPLPAFRQNGSFRAGAPTPRRPIPISGINPRAFILLCLPLQAFTMWASLRRNRMEREAYERMEMFLQKLGDHLESNGWRL
jgi:hypothetical protein